MTTLHLVTGLYSCINSFASRYVDPLEDHYVVVLFTDREDEASIAERIRRIQGVRKVVFLRNPATYRAKLSDPKRVFRWCSGKVPTQLRMFFSHSSWLLNSLAAAAPGAAVSLFEEGMAGLYPGNLAPLNFLERVVRVEYHDYLGRIRPLSSVQNPELFEELDASLFLGRLEQACGTSSVELGSGTVVLAEQYFDRKAASVPTGELQQLYADAAITIIGKGYRVIYKAHPRHRSEIFDFVNSAVSTAGLEGLSLMEARDVPLEALMSSSRPAAIVAVNSTLLLSAPHLLGVPSFRIETDYGLRLASSLPAERLGQLANHLLLRDRIPPLAELPQPGSRRDAWTIMSRSAESVPATTDDPLLMALCREAPAPSAELVEAFRTIESSAASHVSFDLFDTLVVRPASNGSEVFTLLDREAAPLLPAAVRFSNARSSAVQSLRSRARLAGGEWEEYPMAAVAAETSHLLSAAIPPERIEAIEFGLERRLLGARDLGLALLTNARRLGKRIGIVSDTFYSAERLWELVGHLFPLTPDFIFTSADIGCTKAAGGLFDAVLQRLSIPPERLLHVGDSPASDVARPAERGISTLHVPSTYSAARRQLWSGQLWSGFREESGLGLVKGLIANRYFDNPFVETPSGVSLGTPRSIGYAVVGPALLGWTLWIARQALVGGYDRVGFLARDGFVPRGIYRRLRQIDPRLPEDRYLFASRRLAFQVFSSDPSHIAMTKFVHGLNPRNTPRKLLDNRVGPHAVALLGPALAKAGIHELDQPLGSENLAALITILTENAEQLAVSNRRSSAAARHYYQEQLAGSTRPVVVDLGYSGSSQRAIMASRDDRVDGLYFVTMEHALEYSMITEAKFEPWSHDRTFFTYGTVLEYLVTPLDLHECLGVDENSGRPILLPVPRRDGVNVAIQWGIQEFIDDVFSIFGAHVFDLAMRPDSATRALAALIATPTEADAALFVGATQDDSAGSGNSELLESWLPARQVLRQRSQKEPRSEAGAPRRRGRTRGVLVQP